MRVGFMHEGVVIIIFININSKIYRILVKKLKIKIFSILCSIILLFRINVVVMAHYYHHHLKIKCLERDTDSKSRNEHLNLGKNQEISR